MSQRDRDYGARLPTQFKEGATTRIARQLAQRRRRFADKVPGGAGDKTDLEDLSVEELELIPDAIKEEMAHTNDPEVALEIVFDHREDKGMEQEYGKEASIRIAARNEVSSDFQSLGNGFYRKGHQIWELQKLNDPDSPFRLVRKHEERHIDAMDRDLEDYTAGWIPDKASEGKLRQLVAAAKCECGHDDCPDDCPPSCPCKSKYATLKVGQKVSTIRDGRVAQAIILLIEEDDTADIEYSDGDMEEGMPLEMLFPLDLPMMPSIEECEMEDDDFEPEISEEKEDDDEGEDDEE
jgi:hypothetical protein